MRNDCPGPVVKLETNIPTVYGRFCWRRDQAFKAPDCGQARSAGEEQFRSAMRSSDIFDENAEDIIGSV